MTSTVEATPLCITVPKESAKQMRLQLEEHGLFDSCRSLSVLSDGSVAIPITSDEESVAKIRCQWPACEVKSLNLPISKKSQAKQGTPYAKLQEQICSLMKRHGISDALMKEIPNKWERHQDLVIIPANSFISEEWRKIDNLWSIVASCLSCHRIARRSTIANDCVRSSQVSLLLGDSSWVTHIDNNIRYSYDVTKCMFSVGNITEKLRVASWDCGGQTVVDMYAGIGYFTLPYLIHAKAAHVHACDWNPEALVALRHNLADNGVADRCTVHEGDSRQIYLGPIADHVNLGLIPSSEAGWPTAVKLLSVYGGQLHIHNNVDESWGNTSGDQTVEDKPSEDNSINIREPKESSKKRQALACQRWSSYAANEISRLLHTLRGGETGWSVKQIHLELVKSYAPRIVHVVLDLDCRPVKNGVCSDT